MNIKTIAALLVLTSASLVLPQDSLAGKPEGRTPKDKTCPFEAVSLDCTTELLFSFTEVDRLFNEPGNFLSRNAEKNAGTLKCKVSGADIKLSVEKTHEAAYLMFVALEKVRSLYAHRKLSGQALADLTAAFTATQECIDE
jgi:hypothetical protein